MNCIRLLPLFAGATLVMFWGCSGTQGGSSGSGGSRAGVGGNSESGGSSNAGTPNSTGGSVAVAGSTVTGGAPATGGTPSAGGTSASGGSIATGGASAAGGTAQYVNCGDVALSPTCPEGVSAMCGMLDALNAVRAAAPGASPPLPPLIWDCSLAAGAQAWADSCPAGHNTTLLNANNLGENIYGTSSKTAIAPSDAVNLWASEGPPNYVYSTNYCAGAPYTNTNFNCGHYTQIVWRTTTSVGCGFKTGCSSGFASQIWVCDFSPAGNIYDPKTQAFKLPY